MIMEYFGFSVIFSFLNNFFLYWIEYIKEKKVYNEPLPVQHWTNPKECFLGNIFMIMNEVLTICLLNNMEN